MLINAKEAKELVNKAVEVRLEKVMSKIQEECQKGNSYLCLDDLDGSVKKMLLELGYKVSEPVQYQGGGYRIKW